MKRELTPHMGKARAALVDELQMFAGSNDEIADVICAVAYLFKGAHTIPKGPFIRTMRLAMGTRRKVGALDHPEVARTEVAYFEAACGYTSRKVTRFYLWLLENELHQRKRLRHGTDADTFLEESNLERIKL